MDSILMVHVSAAAFRPNHHGAKLATTSSPYRKSKQQFK
jgi:hypothetical protein